MCVRGEIVYWRTLRADHKEFHQSTRNRTCTSPVTSLSGLETRGLQMVACLSPRSFLLWAWQLTCGLGMQALWEGRDWIKETWLMQTCIFRNYIVE